MKRVLLKDISKSKLTGGEVGDAGIKYNACTAIEDPSGIGQMIHNFYSGSIIELKDSTLLTEKGQRSRDSGKSWSAEKQLFDDPDEVAVRGMLRLPNGDLGIYYVKGGSIEAALGDTTTTWYSRWSADEGQTWSDKVSITIPGLTQGLSGTHFTLQSGRVCIVTYSQFVSAQELWGGSWGMYKGHRIKTESEAHFAEMLVTRVYYTDDNCRSWKANKSWIMGWRESKPKWTDSFVEATGCQLRDGRIYLIGRSLIGRMLECHSENDGELFSYAKPTALMSSYSPGRLIQDPDNGNLIYVWNQISRAENKRGFRRCRLSSAVSTDEGKTWENFKNIYAIDCLKGKSHLEPDSDLTPAWGDDEIGELPEDFEMWHYPTASLIGRDVFMGLVHNAIEVATNDSGEEEAKYKHDSLTRVIPLDWFYET